MHAEKSPVAALAATTPLTATANTIPTVRRLTTVGLMQDQREVEIEHGGKIYRLRITQLNKLILTA